MAIHHSTELKFPEQITNLSFTKGGREGQDPEVPGQLEETFIRVNIETLRDLLGKTVRQT